MGIVVFMAISNAKGLYHRTLVLLVTAIIGKLAMQRYTRL